jgi:hypothetical protein
MKLRITLLINFILLSVFTAFSQVRVGLTIGGNASTNYFDIDSDFGDEPPTKYKLGLRAGVLVEIPLIPEKLSLQPSLLYSGKGFSYDMKKELEDQLRPSGANLDSYSGYARVKYNYVEVPLNLVYTLKGFQFLAGPYMAYGIGGSFKHDFSFIVNGQKTDSEDIYPSDELDIKPIYKEVDQELYDELTKDEDLLDYFRGFDYGLNFGLGYRIQRVQLNVGYSLGLGNMTAKYNVPSVDLGSEVAEKVIQKNRAFTFSIALFIDQ